MSLSKSAAKKAFEGNDIICSRKLPASGAILPKECAEAIMAVGENYADFCQLIRNEMNRWPLTKHYFQNLVEARLQQNAVLDSKFIARLLDDTNPTEDRLNRLDGKVSNLESIVSGVGAPTNPTAGEETDEIILDLWNEILVMDFILHEPGLAFTNVEKVVRRRDLPQVDLIAQCNGSDYAIEITRIRKRDFKGSTLPNMFHAIFRPENIGSLRTVLKNKLHSKNKQMDKFCVAETRAFDKRLVVIKTSQWEYQDGSTVVCDETKTLLDSGAYPAIDEILLIYDTREYDWLRQPPTQVPTNRYSPPVPR